MLKLVNRRKLRVTTQTGKVMEIPKKHTLFAPVGSYASGDSVDPQTVEVRPFKAANLGVGHLVIVDNLVEVIVEVAS